MSYLSVIGDGALEYRMHAQYGRLGQVDYRHGQQGAEHAAVADRECTALHVSWR